jgi:hypothetical protein
VAWLDGRDAHAADGTPHGHVAGSHSMRQDVYAAVVPDRGPAAETRVATNVCFCCKTSVAVGPDGATYVAWRHVYPPNLRDVAVARSTDGIHFEAPVRVSEDHWQIDACPEDGPSLGVSDDGVVHVAWPTVLQGAASRKAIFYSTSADEGRSFSPRTRVDSPSGTAIAEHPQVAVNGTTAIVIWDEIRKDDDRIFMRAMLGPAGNARAIDGSARGVYPAAVVSDGAVVVAWTSPAAGTSTIAVSRAPFPGVPDGRR